MPDHLVLEAAVRGEPARCTDAELVLRRELALPPASALALLSGAAAAGYATALAERRGRKGSAGSLEVSELEGGRWLVQASDHANLCDALAAVARPAGALRVVVDPLDV
jgi:hypothetical protein